MNKKALIGIALGATALVGWALWPEQPIVTETGVAVGAVPMETSYKFWYVTRQDDVHISEVAVRFYEGKTEEKLERKINMETMVTSDVPITRYRRSRELTKADRPDLATRRMKKDARGVDTFIFTNADFGTTSNLNDVVSYLNTVLAQDTTRTPIPEEKVK